MSVAAYVAAAAVMALGACVQGAVGFGSNLIAAPLLVLIDPTFVPGPVSVASLALNVLIITTRSDGEHDRRIKWALVGLLPGTLLAGVLLSVLPERGLSLTFAAMVLVAVALSASGLSLAITSAHLSGAGFLSGFMGTVSGIGGPPIALVYQHEPASVLRGTLPRFFFLGGLISVATLMVVGRLGYDEIGPTLALLPGLFVGLSLSRPLARHLDKRTARPAVLGLSMVAAAAVLIRELLVMAAPALRLTDVNLVRDGTRILHDVSWTVQPDERWVVLGANGSGKTSLVRIASLYLHPSSGTVEVLGATLGRVDVRSHRRRIGLVSSSFTDLLRPALTAADIVMTAKHAALEPWWHEYDDGDRDRAISLLERFGCAPLADRVFATLSSGERQRVQLARTLMADPGLLLLDEPSAGLDLGGREDLVHRLAALAHDSSTPATVLVTHHVEEIPDGFEHVLLLRGGRVVAAGPIGEVLTPEALGACFGVDLQLEHRNGRWWAWS